MEVEAKRGGRRKQTKTKIEPKSSDKGGLGNYFNTTRVQVPKLLSGARRTKFIKEVTTAAAKDAFGRAAVAGFGELWEKVTINRI